MALPPLLRSAAVGLATALVVGVVVTELAASQIAFSLFLGIPAGVLAGLAAAAYVHLRLAEPGPERRRTAVALGNAGLAFLVVLVGSALLANTGAVIALAVGAVAGLVVGAVSWVVVD